LTEDLAAELTAAIKGHIVLVSQKGNCTFIEKAETVEVCSFKYVVSNLKCLLFFMFYFRGMEGKA